MTDKTNIPNDEQWFYDNPEVLAAVEEGLAQAQSGQVSDGSYVQEVVDRIVCECRTVLKRLSKTK